MPHEAAFSPIVLVGLVRIIETALIIAVGLGVYVCYVVPGHDRAEARVRITLIQT